VIVLFVALGAAVGAPVRYLTDRAVQSRHRTRFPWGTLVVNLVASLVLGIVAGDQLSAELTALVGTGFCGGLSTFSTFSYETVRLAEVRAWFESASNVFASLIGGLGAVTLGWSIGQALLH
jgi:CrcB protein